MSFFQGLLQMNECNLYASRLNLKDVNVVTKCLFVIFDSILKMQMLQLNAYFVIFEIFIFGVF